MKLITALVTFAVLLIPAVAAACPKCFATAHPAVADGSTLVYGGATAVAVALVSGAISLWRAR